MTETAWSSKPASYTILGLGNHAEYMISSDWSNLPLSHSQNTNITFSPTRHCYLLFSCVHFTFDLSLDLSSQLHSFIPLCPPLSRSDNHCNLSFSASSSFSLMLKKPNLLPQSVLPPPIFYINFGNIYKQAPTCSFILISMEVRFIFLPFLLFLSFT